jgi:hypothetical protein
MVCGYVVSEGLILSLKMVDVWNERERERERLSHLFLFFFFSFSAHFSLFFFPSTFGFSLLFFFIFRFLHGMGQALFIPLFIFYSFLSSTIFYSFFIICFLSLSCYLLVIWRVGQNFAFLFFFLKICLKIGVKNELRQLPSLYNTYGINTLEINICLTLYSKFVKKRKITQEKKVFFFGRTSKWKTKVIMSNDNKA